MNIIPLNLVSSLIAAALAIAPSSGEPSSAATPRAEIRNDVRDDFAIPHDRVDIGGGRRINLHCLGQGPRTVLFDAGGSDWSVIWALVQPKAAARVRACSYDRAGLGYSDAAAGPRSPIAIVEDVHALVKAAGLRTPLVVVGHSLGGFNMKLYAALFPDDVAALVLVDPAEDRASERTGARLRRMVGDPLAARIALSDADAIRQAVARYDACAATARSGDLDPQSLTYRRCSDPVRPALGPAIAAERARIQVTRSYQDAQASELANSVYGQVSGDDSYRMLFRPGRFGSKPMIVLSHGTYDRADPVEAAGFQQYLWLHAETAALSRRGRQRTVPDTSHNIEIDAPDAIVAAIMEVIDQLDGRTRR